MTPRIPLDSQLWHAPDLLGQEPGFNQQLEELLSEASPDPGKVRALIESTWLTDFPAPQFHYMIPWLLDLFETQGAVLQDAIVAFCTCLYRAYDGKPSDICLGQIRDNRERTMNVLVHALETSSARGHKDTENFKYLLAIRRSGFLLHRFCRQHHAAYFTLDHRFFIDPALEGADDHGVFAVPGNASHHNQPVAGHDHVAEFDVVHAAETNDTILPQSITTGQIGDQLRCRFAHHHARH